MHLFGHNCDHDYYFELPREGERDAQSITRCSTAHHRDFRAVPRANRTFSPARNPIPCATSRTSGPLTCGPWRPWQSSARVASPGGNTYCATLGCCNHRLRLWRGAMLPLWVDRRRLPKTAQSVSDSLGDSHPHPPRVRSRPRAEKIFRKIRADWPARGENKAQSCAIACSRQLTTVRYIAHARSAPLSVVNSVSEAAVSLDIILKGVNHSGCGSPIRRSRSA
jgi:hypothetical protein